jgi:hypothetical protein
MVEGGFAYTVATHRLFMGMAEFHRQAEELLGREIWTHEFGMADTWSELAEALEEKLLFEFSEEEE